MSPSRPRSTRTRYASSTRLLAPCASAALFFAVACFDGVVPPTGLDPESLNFVSRIDCVASTVARSVSCAPTSAPSVLMDDHQSGLRPAPAPVRDVILGNQGGFVKLTSSNIDVTTPGVFAFDVTLTNLIPQPIGTTNGFSADSAGSRVFFFSGPQRTSGTGTIDFVNGGGFYYDGTNTFTAAAQPYFKYVGLLRTGDVTATKTWRFRYDPGVLTFSFSVFVSTPVKFPNGYISGNPSVLTLNPAEQSASLGGTVRTAAGTPIGGTIVYDDSASGVVTVNASGVVTAGPSKGIAHVYLNSGIIPNYFSTAVNVCAPTPTLVNGSSVNGTINASDCFSSFAGNNDRPDPSYQSDLYRVALTAGQQIGITMTSDGSFDPCLYLADPAGVLVFSPACTSGATETIPLGAPMPVTGIYTIEAGQTAPFAGTPGNYTLTVTIAP